MVAITLPGRRRAAAFKEAPEGGGTPGADTATEDREAEAPEKLHCARCGALVTDGAARIPVHGAHDHHCVNPAGAGVHIGCFAAAPGVVQMGNHSYDYTWFPSYAWRVALCAACSHHLGWSFEGAEEPRLFHGLILDRLTSRGKD